MFGSLRHAAAVAAIALGGAPAFAATLSATSGPFGAVPDRNAAGVSGTAAFATGGTITDVNVTLNELSTTWIGDLVVTLTSPAATSVSLLCRIGTSPCNPDLGTPFGDGSDLTGDITLDDEAGTTLADAAVAAGASMAPGTYSPANPASGQPDMLSAFDGEDVLGIWTLNIADFAVGDATSLGSFTVTVKTGTGDPNVIPLPAGAVLLLSGLGGLAALRRRAV